MAKKQNPLETIDLAEEISRGSQSEAETLPSKIERYSRARERAVTMIHHVDAEYQKTQSPFLMKARDGLIECGNYLHFRNYYTVEKVRLHQAFFCKKHLFCPLCAIRRASKQMTSYLSRYKAVIAQNPTLRPYMITMTVKNGTELLERYDHLVAGIRTLTRNRTRALTSKNDRRRTEFSKIVGAVGSYEFTNKGKGWHPHVHIIALCEVPPDSTLLALEWKKATKDSYIVDVRPVGNPEEPVKGFAEVFKYALKFSDLTPQQNIEAALLLNKRRLLFSFGVFRGVVVPESLLDEPLEDLPFIDLIYRYLDGVGYSLTEFTQK